MQSSNSVAAGDVISTSPAAGTQVAAGSTVNLTVSSGPPVPHFAYVANSSDATISAYSFDPSTGATTPLGAATPVTGNCSPCKPGSLQEIKTDPSGKYLYVISQADDNLYGFSINADGSLTAMATSPFATGGKPQSLAFDGTGTFLYVLNVLGNGTVPSISVFQLGAGGALTALATPHITAGHTPAQIARTGSFLYVVLTPASAVDVFTISANAPYLTESTDPKSPYPTDAGPFGLAIDPAGTVLYTANSGTGAGSISSFKINPDGSLTSFCAPMPCALAIPATSDIGIDPVQGKYLFVTEQISGKGNVDVWPIDSNSATGLGPMAVTGSPFLTGGLNPNAISFDSSGQWVFSGNDGSANFAEFSLDGSTGALKAVTGSPIAAGNNPDFIVID
jgi:6-phosphogluconolactonase (cycloisomerase 2 family)